MMANTSSPLPSQQEQGLNFRHQQRMTTPRAASPRCCPSSRVPCGLSFRCSTRLSQYPALLLGMATRVLLLRALSRLGRGCTQDVMAKIVSCNTVPVATSAERARRHC